MVLNRSKFKTKHFFWFTNFLCKPNPKILNLQEFYCCKLPISLTNPHLKNLPPLTLTLMGVTFPSPSQITKNLYFLYSMTNDLYKKFPKFVKICLGTVTVHKCPDGQCYHWAIIITLRDLQQQCSIIYISTF